MEGGTTFRLFCNAEISAEVVTKCRRKRRITVGLLQLNTRLPPCLFFLFLLLGSTELTADRLAQLEEYRTTVREVVGSNPGRTTTQGL